MNTDEAYDNAVAYINDITARHVEYETTHRDAGDSYAHMPCESWCSDHDKRLAESMKDAGIDAGDRTPEELADLVLENFTMHTGHIFSTNSDLIVLDSYHVQEVEIDIQEELASLPPEISAQIVDGNDTDAYITGTDRAYQTTDAVWLAAITPSALRELLRTN